MNKSYKSVWNESTGSWVAVSELATGRSKSKRAKTAISKAILTQIAVGGMGLAGASIAMAGDPVKFGTDAAVNVADGVAIGTDATVDADFGTNAGKTGGVAIGNSAYSTGSGVSIGQNASAGSDSMAMGDSASANLGGTAIGQNASSFAAQSVALGQNASAAGQGSLALGANSNAEFKNSTAIGQGATTDRAESVSVGSATIKRQITNVAAGTQDTDATNVSQLKALGAAFDTNGHVTNTFVSYDSSVKDVLTLGGAAGTKITNVANGALTTASKDAVNGSQLLAVAQSAADAVGGSSTVGADGKITKPVYTVSGKTFTSLDSALTGVATMAGTGGTGGTDPDAVHYDQAAHTSVTLGAAGAPVKVSNVAAGTSTTDAVNVGQMNTATNGLAQAVASLKYMGVSATSTGSQAMASGKDAMAVGGSAFASADNALAFGTNARATGVNSIAIGAGSTASKDNTFSIGSVGAERRLVNVAIGTGKTDAVNLGQVQSLIAASAPVQSNGLLKSGGMMLGAGLQDTPPTSSLAPEFLIASGPTDKAQSLQATGTDSIAIGLNTHATGNTSVAMGSNSNSVGNTSVAVGYGTIANGASSQAFGANANSVSDGGLALGNYATVNTDSANATAIGTNSTAVGENAVAFGTEATSIGSGAMVMGNNSSAVGANIVVIGNNSDVENSTGNSIVLGNSNTTSGANSVILGSGVVKATGSNNVVLGNGSDGSQSNVVSIGAAGKERKIVNVAAGTTTTDAVNFGQMNAAIAAGTGSGGGDGVQYDQTAHTSVTLGGTGAAVKLTNVANGTTASDAVNFSQLSALGGKVDSTGKALNAFVAYDNATSMDTITLKGTAGTTKITQLTKGTLSAASTDAVNGSQLFNTASTAAAAIGGGATLDPATGNISKPSITVGGTTYDNIAGATTAAGNAATAAGTAAAAAVTAAGNAVQYDTTGHASVTFGGTGAAVKLTNVANGTTASDAVNFSQLSALGGKVDSTGKAINAFVAYDDTSMNTITLKGAAGTTKITKLTNGAVNATSSDAVNGSQLFVTASSAADAIGGGSSVDATGKISKPSITVGGTTYDNIAGATTAAGNAATAAVAAAGNAVQYDTTGHASVTFGGTGAAVKLTNVANGTTASDAVNFSQLSALGGKVDSTGKAINAFVAYDDTSMNTITLKGAAGTTKITKLTNGAVNATSSDAVNGSQLFNTASSAAAAIGGGSTVDASGVIGKPSIKVGSTTFDNLSGAVVAAAALATTGSTEGVVYDQTAHTSVTFGGTGAAVKLTNVANGTTASDAVNFSQLSALGGKVDSTGKAINAFVAYDDTSMNTITLKGAAGTTKITKLTNGTLSAASTDAVNGSQLFNTASTAAAAIGGGATLDPATGNISKPSITVGGTTYDNIAGATTAAGNAATAAGTAAAAAVAAAGNAVQYDTTGHASVTFGGTGAAVKLTNVANGTTASDAVNFSQLSALGGKVDSTGKAINAFVAYDDTSMSTITLKGAAGTTKITKLSNGLVSASSTDAVNGLQLFNTGSTAAAAIGGGSTVDIAGNISKPSITVGGTTYDNIAAATTAAGNAATAAVSAAGNAVQYDTTGHASVTFGGTGAAVKLTNVANGTTASDAVNFSQLSALGGKVDSTGKAINAFVAYDDTSMNTITLKGAAGTTKITKLTNGTLSAASTDAVNGSQLFNSVSSVATAIGGGSTIDPTTGKISTPKFTVGTTSYDTIAAAFAATGSAVSADGVAYDSSSHNRVTFGGTGSATPVLLSNVAAGVSGTDAVNLNQLKAMGANVDSTGGVANSFVAYDTAAKGKVTLNNGGSAVTIANVATGVSTTDAVNVGQLNAMVAKNDSLATSVKYIGFGPSTAAFANATGTDSMALGGNAFATADRALAIGLNARATYADSVAIGTNSSVSAANTVSVGSAGHERRIMFVATGTKTTDAVNLGQVQSMIAGLAPVQQQQVLQSPVAMSILGANNLGAVASDWSQVIATGDTDKLGTTKAVGKDAVAIGLSAQSTDAQATAIGSNVLATAQGAVAIGNGSLSNGIEATAIGVSSNTTGLHAFAAGYAAASDSEDGIAIGTQATANAAQSGALGAQITVTGAGSFAIGNNMEVAGTDTFILGSNVTNATGNNSVVLGAGSDGSQSNVVSVGAKGTERKIVNVKAGTTTTDAVNFGQMKDAIAAVGTGGSGGDTLVTQPVAGADIFVGKDVAGAHINMGGTAGARELFGVANGKSDDSAVTLAQLKPAVAALGGGAAIDAAGNVTGPTYSIGGKDKHTVGDAFTAVDTNLTNLNNTVAGITAGGTGLVVQDPATGDITVGALLNGSKVNFAGSAGDRVLTGVADGAITSSSSDAVNGKQIAGISSSFATAIGGGSMMNSDGTVTLPSFTVGGDTVHNVGDAISNIDSRVTSVTNNYADLSSKITNISNNGGGEATPNAVAYDSAAKDTLTLGTTDQKTKLTNLQDGDVVAGSTDAVTGNQLFDLEQKVSNAASTGNGSIGVNGANGADGTPGAAGAAGATGADAIAMGDNASASGDHSVVIGGGASASGDGTTVIGGNGSATGANSTAIGSDSNAMGANSVAVGAGSVADRDNSVSVGSEGHERQITNVAPGTQGTDAVNLNQMNSAVGGIARKAYSGIAAATALTMIPDVDANKTLSIGIGGGTFQGYAATAIGGTARITQNIKVRVGAGWSAAGTTVGAGASYQW